MALKYRVFGLRLRLSRGGYFPCLSPAGSDIQVPDRARSDCNSHYFWRFMGFYENVIIKWRNGA